MCKLCDKIYRCTETSPYLNEHIKIDPEGVIQLMVPWYDIISEVDGYCSTYINFCPKCGSELKYYAE